MMKDATFIKRMHAEGYQHVRKLPNGIWIGISPQLFTVGLIVGLTTFGWQRIYHYTTMFHALQDVSLWDGQGDPPGPWIKCKSIDGERTNPVPQ